MTGTIRHIIRCFKIEAVFYCLPLLITSRLIWI